MNTTPRTRFETLSRLAIIIAPLAFLASACAAPAQPDGTAGEALGEAAEASTATPTCVTIQRGTAGTVEDSLIAADNPTKLHGTSTVVSAGIAVTGGQREALIKWDTSSIPAASIVTSATATFSVALFNTGGPINVHQVTAPWSEATVTWSSFNQAFAPAITAVLAGNATDTADLTALAQGWVDGSIENDGVLLERAWGFINYNSSDATVTSQRPELQVCYVPDPCAGVVCAPVDACHAAGTCNRATGQCDPGPSIGDVTTGLSHHWTFDEGSGTSAGDSAGAANGTLGSSAEWATSFDGSGAILINPKSANDMNGYVDFGSAPGAFGTADFSVSFWVASTFNGSGHGDLLGNRVNASNGDFVSVRMNGSGIASVEIDNGGTDYNATSSAPVAINDGNWHHVAISRSGATLNEYVDGALVGSRSSAAPTNIVGAHPFKVGRSLAGYLTSFAALYDDVRIYDRPLGTCDLQDLGGGHAGTPATIPPPPPPSCPCAGTPAWDSALAQTADSCDDSSPAYIDLYFAGWNGEAVAYSDGAGYGFCYAYDANGNETYFDASSADAALCLAQLAPHCP